MGTNIVMSWKRWLVIGFMAASIGMAWLSVRAEEVSGDQFRKLVVASDSQSNSSWYLYNKTEDAYCFRYPRPVVPKRYCVSKQDLEVKNGPNGGVVVGYVYKNQFVLKPNRYPGASLEVF